MLSESEVIRLMACFTVGDERFRPGGCAVDSLSQLPWHIEYGATAALTSIRPSLDNAESTNLGSGCGLYSALLDVHVWRLVPGR